MTDQEHFCFCNNKQFTIGQDPRVEDRCHRDDLPLDLFVGNIDFSNETGGDNNHPTGDDNTQRFQSNIFRNRKNLNDRFMSIVIMQLEK